MIHREQDVRSVTMHTTTLIVGGLLFWSLTLGILCVPNTAEAVKFPENHITLMKYWGKSKDVDSAIKELNALLALLPPDVDFQNDYSGYNKVTKEHQKFIDKIKDDNKKTQQVQKQRKYLLLLLAEIKELYQGYEYLQNEELGLALSVFINFPSRMSAWEKAASGGSYVSVSALENFLSQGLLGKGRDYYEGFNIDWWDYPDAYGLDYTKKTLREYKGPITTAALLRSFWYDWKSNRFGAFELDLLLAETYHQLGDYRRAQQIYDLLLQNDGYYNPVSNKKDLFSDPEKKFVRIHSAFNQIAWGDRYFKRAHGLPDCAKDEQLKLALNKYLYAQQDLDDLCDKVGIGEPPSVGLGTGEEAGAGKNFELVSPGDSHPGGESLSIARPNSTVEAARADALTESLAALPERRFQVMEDGDKQESGQVVQDVLYMESLSDQAGLDKMLKNLAKDYTVSTTADVRYSVMATGCTEPDHNPLIVEACARAKMQIFKIREKFNYLGYPDGYVPDQRYKLLYSKANEYADLTISAENRYIQFKKEAENLEYMSRQLGQNAQLTIYQEQIAKTRRTMADMKVSQSEARIKAIDAKVSAIKSTSLWGAIGGMFTAFASAATFNYGGMTSSMFGMITNEISSSGEIQALNYQKEAEQLNRKIAIKEEYIADLEILIGQMQSAFLNDNLNFLASKEMNKDLHYYLAKTLDRIKETYLEAGIRMGYLAERALAFETGRSDLQVIKFDYELSVIKGLLAGDFLKQDLIMMENDRVLALKQRNHVKHVISLRDHYPIEFARFLETGSMDFATGPYEFDRAYPGTYQRRLKRVEVAVQGLVGPEGFKGSLTNFGSFVVRSKDKTLGTFPTSPGMVPLTVPKLMYGVYAYSLPPARLVLSSYDIRKDQLIFPPETETREVFEGFSPAGLWRLELPKNLNDVDYRTIADVQLLLYFDAFYHQDLERKMVGYYDSVKNVRVEGLIQKYVDEKSGGKKLDKIAMFSLRQHFPDEFFSFTSGAVEFELLDADFPLYAKDKTVKKVIVRCMGKSGSGVQGISIMVTRNGSTNLKLGAITDASGFTIDPAQAKDLSPSDQVPVVGLWKVELRDPSQVKLVDDILLFFEYEYQERK